MDCNLRNKLERILTFVSVLASVVILLIRYKYKERDGGEPTERERGQRDRQFVTVCRQTEPDIMETTNRGKHPDRFFISTFKRAEKGNSDLYLPGNIPQLQSKKQQVQREESSDRELALISDTNMWVREKAETRGLNITINPSTESESPGSSWTPLLHNLSTESIL